MEVYLDNSATTKPRDKVIEEINRILTKDYGNPSSLHRKGLEAEKNIKSARKNISNYLRVREDEIFFTSGGTESNNLAIQGLINKNSKNGNHIITTKIEHPSVLNIFKHYENKGFDVTYLNVDRYGFIDLKELENAISDDTIFISIMLVNNELGTIQPIKEISNLIKTRKRDIKIHVDGIQAFGKIEFNINNLDIDTFSFSSHKIHGPKGVGGLYARKDVKLAPIFYGGNQERGIRSGTENVAGIVGLGKAVDIINHNFELENLKLKKLKNYFIEKIKLSINNIKINSKMDNSFAPHILNISFKGVKGEVLLHYLENDNIYVSTGSACSSNNKGKSHVLKTIGLKDNLIDGTVRFSFAYTNTEEEIDYVITKLKKSVEEIRKITMR
ncbi:MAG: cysteine desulfurase [Firmicutes bacterium]|nr:cysteine desulfurase [Bacillota bacterium]